MQKMNNILDNFKLVMPVGTASTEHSVKVDVMGYTICGVARTYDDEFLVLCKYDNGLCIDKVAEQNDLSHIWKVWGAALKETYGYDDERCYQHIMSLHTIGCDVWECAETKPSFNEHSVIVFKYHRLDNEDTGLICSCRPELLQDDSIEGYLYNRTAFVFRAEGILYLDDDLKSSINALVNYGDDEAIIINEQVAISYSYEKILI